MHACYLGPVGGDNPVSQLSCLGYPSPVGTVLFGHDGGRCHEDTWPPRAGLRGRMIPGGMMRESLVRQVLLEQCWSTRMG